jgi:glycosyltransferase involved in cell wall biosynthesis
MNEICGNSAASFVLKNFNNFKLPLEPNNSNSKLNILFLGSLIESKGISQFVNASKEVDFDFNVCGMGGNGCLDYVLSAASEGFLKYHGVVHGKIKEQLFHQADIFVLQTSYKIEGVPLALLEAMASGCAVLTTQHNGIPETVGDSGLFLQDLTPKELISKIDYLDKNRKILVDYQQKALLRSKDFKREHFKSQIKTIIERS